ncbi:MAG: response regulator [Bacteroidota bacterium]
MKKLLIIDDESSTSLLLRWLLRDEPYQTFTANSFKEAVNLLRENAFHLILLDLIMPDVDGFEMLDYLKADKRLQKIPVIIVSVKSGRESIEAALRKGARDYIVKPYNTRDLRNKIEIILETYLSTKTETD